MDTMMLMCIRAIRCCIRSIWEDGDIVASMWKGRGWMGHVKGEGHVARTRHIPLAQRRVRVKHRVCARERQIPSQIDAT